MKNLLLPILILAAAINASAQQRGSVPMSAKTIVPVATNSTGDAAADREHDALWAAWRATPPDGLTRTNRAYWEWQDKVFKKFAEDAQSFAQKYPKDPRRWEAIVQMGFTPPFFITGFKPGFDAQPSLANLIVDESAMADFKARQSKLNREVVLADETTPRQRTGALGWMVMDTQNTALKEGKKPDLKQFEPLLEEAAAKLPDERGAGLLNTYLSVLGQSAPDEAAAFEAKLADKPVGKVLKELRARQEQARAETKAKLKEAAADIGTIKFTSADGRPVDLAKLRGKVVLIDFWATWCGPCIKEIPNVVANYKKYHDKGFEIVGITLENSGLAAGDNGEVMNKKLAAAREKMLAFTKKNDMTWPQHFDGQYWQNEYAVKYGIHAIPAMFLLDKDGNVASTEARGPDLEKELKRLLGL